jgi:hypothetical protein
MEECRDNHDTLPVFTLADLSKKYSVILDELGVDQNARVHIHTYIHTYIFIEQFPTGLFNAHYNKS